jgi:hypothetical protein
MTVIIKANAGILKDGTGNILDTGSPYQFDGDVLSMTSKNCTKVDASGTEVITYTCTGTYYVFLTKDGDTPIRLRFEVIEDPNDMRKGILTQPLVWVEK